MQMQTNADPHKLAPQGHTWIDAEKTNWIVQAGVTLSGFITNVYIHNFVVKLHAKLCIPILCVTLNGGNGNISVRKRINIKCSLQTAAVNP
jgi:hypothetical protein